MTSNVDVTKPTEGMAFTADVRDNFQIISTEITDLQTRVAALESAVVALLTKQEKPNG
jgi:hypothetical protein